MSSGNESMTNDILFCMWNVRSICNKLSYVCQFFEDSKFDVILVFETWLSSLECYQTSFIKDETKVW